MSDSTFALLVIGAVLLIIGLIAFTIIHTIKRSKQPLDAMVKNRRLLYAVYGKHKSGLSAPSGATLKVGYGENGFIIVGNGMEITIAIDNITDVDYFLRTSKTAMTRGAAHGRHVYGKKVGGLIGVAQTIQYDFVISYTSGKKIQKVAFSIDGGNNDCRRIIEHFKANKKKSTIRMELSSPANTVEATAQSKVQNTSSKPVRSASPLQFDASTIALLVKAGEIAVKCGSLTTTLLQKELNLGYANASKTMDELERQGIISQYNGAKPRNVLINEEQFKEWKLSLCKKQETTT